MAEKKEKIIFVKETTLGSIVSDIFTFGGIVSSFWFNYRFIGGNDALDILLFTVFFLFAMSKAANYRKLKELTNQPLNGGMYGKRIHD
jgi:hypothetical protein